MAVMPPNKVSIKFSSVRWLTVGLGNSPQSSHGEFGKGRK
nr:MAG TPA: hypothetical protein [Caudoviricetes sp.]